MNKRWKSSIQPFHVPCYGSSLTHFIRIERINATLLLNITEMLTQLWNSVGPEYLECKNPENWLVCLLLTAGNIWKIPHIQDFKWLFNKSFHRTLLIFWMQETSSWLISFRFFSFVCVKISYKYCILKMGLNFLIRFVFYPIFISFMLARGPITFPFFPLVSNYFKVWTTHTVAIGYGR